MRCIARMPVCTVPNPVVTCATFNCRGTTLIGSTCSGTCDAGYEATGSLETLCTDSSSFTTVLGTCQDIDGCANNPCNAPASGATCADISAPLTGYTCDCKPGYEWDAGTFSCQDINGCADDPCNAGSNVGSSGTCIDASPPLVDYACSCSAGFLWNAASKACEASQCVSIVAGNGNAGYSGHGADAALSELSEPYDVAVGAASDIYIAGTLCMRQD
jgi:hypothetical protein